MPLDLMVVYLPACNCRVSIRVRVRVRVKVGVRIRVRVSGLTDSRWSEDYS